MPAGIPHEALARATRAAFGAAVSVVATQPLAGDASTRRYVRIRLDGAGAPPTVVAMLLPSDRPGMSDELGDTAASHEEPFVNVGRYLGRHGLPVPAIYHDAARADSLLLVEDVGDRSLWAAVGGEPDTVPARFAASVDLLVTLQLVGRRAPDPGCCAFTRRFDAALARAELEHFVEHGVETRRGHPLPAAARRALMDALEPLVAPFAGDHLVLAHRDFMAWNLHVQDDRLRLIDFQDALLAPDAFDLAQLLTDRTTSSVVGPHLEAELIARFRDARAAGAWPLAGDFTDRYRRCALQHALKVIGRFHFLELVRGRPGYLAYLPGVYTVARRMLDALPALGSARPLLAAHVPELA